MTKAITKTWLRRVHRQQRSTKPFREWAKDEGRSAVRHYLTSADCQARYEDGVNHNVAALTGLPMGEAAEGKYLRELELRKARKDRSRTAARATTAARHARSAKKKG